MVKDLHLKIWTSEIVNHSADGLCCQHVCNEKPTHYFKLNINGMELFISLCERHANKIEQFNLED